MGKERLLYSFGDLVKDFHMQIILATDKVIAREAAGGARVHGGMARNRGLTPRRTRPKPLAITQKVLGFHPDVLNRAYDRLIDNYSTDGRFNRRALAVLARSYVELKLLDQEPDMSKLTTEEFLPKK